MDARFSHNLGMFWSHKSKCCIWIRPPEPPCRGRSIIRAVKCTLCLCWLVGTEIRLGSTSTNCAWSDKLIKAEIQIRFNQQARHHSPTICRTGWKRVLPLSYPSLKKILMAANRLLCIQTCVSQACEQHLQQSKCQLPILQQVIHSNLGNRASGF